jgi:hypothetical protein
MRLVRAHSLRLGAGPAEQRSGRSRPGCRPSPKFGVRGGSYTEQLRRLVDHARVGKTSRRRVISMNRLAGSHRAADPAVKVLFVYNCNPAVTVPDQRRILEGLEREDLFTVVFDQVMTDTAAYADLVLPATSFLEHYDLARSYGPISLQMVRPVVDSAGEARPNAEVFGQLSTALNLDGDEGPYGELETLLVMDLPQGSETLRAVGSEPRGLAPVQFVDVFPRTADGKVDVPGRRAGVDSRLITTSRRGSPCPGAIARQHRTISLDARRAAAPTALVSTRWTPTPGSSRRDRWYGCSTTSARYGARRASSRRCAPAPSSCRRACGGGAPRTASPRPRWCPTP